MSHRSTHGAPCAVLVLLCSTVAAAAEPFAIEAAIRAGLTGNPSLLSLRADLDSARAQLEGASLLLQANPTLQGSFGPRFDPERNYNADIGLQQRFEIFGQRAARKDAAAATVIASEARLTARTVEVAAEIREAFGRALAAEQQLRISEQGMSVAASARKAAEERFAAGSATRMEVNAARVEIGRATRELSQAQRRRREAHGDLALLVGIAPVELVLTGALNTTVANAGSDTELLSTALQNRADLGAARAEIEAARAQQRLAGREVLPSPIVGVRYAAEEGYHIFQGTLGIELPVFNQNQAGRGSAVARLSQSERALEAAQRRIQAEVAVASSRHRAAIAAAEAYVGDVVMAMEENTQLVTEAYRAGKVDFLELVVIQRQSLDARRGYVEALEELNAADANLKRVVGSMQ